MDEFRLARVRGEQSADLWPLPPNRPSLLGRPDPSRGAPDVDLWPDNRVSRAHARLIPTARGWQIEDLASKHGTLVDGAQIQGLGPVPLLPGSEITLGDTVLTLASPHWHRLRGHGVVVDLEITPALNLALAHCGLPVVSRLVARNTGRTDVPGGTLTFDLTDRAHPMEVVVPPLAPGQSVPLPSPRWVPEYEALEGRIERSRQSLTVLLDGQPLRGDPVQYWVLAHNDWSYADDHRLSLAAFVLPNHPLIAEVALDVARAGSDDPEAILAAVYEHFAERWRLEYQYEPRHWHTTSQKIRLPHQVLLQPERRLGQGTCIDLALLIAAVLEHLGLQAVIAVLELEAWRHAVVGCRRTPDAGLEPLLLDRGRLLDDVVWIEPTGCTRDLEARLPFAEARAAAQAVLAEKPLVFGLDVAAARAEGLTPLPLAGEPRWGASGGAVLAAADAAAQSAGAPLGTIPLLIGLLRASRGRTRELLAEALGTLEGSAVALQAALATQAGQRPSASYGSVLGHARSLARGDDSPFVLEVHLLRALLEIPSESLDRALDRLDTDRVSLLHALRPLLAHGPGDLSLIERTWPPRRDPNTAR